MIKTVPLPDEVYKIKLYPFSGLRYTCDLETKLLCFLASNSNGNILEVGCNSGITTREFALSCPDKEIFAVDYFGDRNWMNKEQQYEKPDEFIFGKYVKDYSNVHLFNSKFSDFDLGKSTISFAFIDGDHTFSAVKEDSEKILNLFCKQGSGTIVWHDYYTDGPEWCGVRKYIDEVFSDSNYIVNLYEGTCIASLVI